MSGTPYENAEAVSYGTTWVPTALASAGQAYTRTAAVLCTVAGTLVCDFWGNVNNAGYTPGATNVSVPFAVNQIIEIAIIKIHTGSSGSFVAFYP